MRQTGPALAIAALTVTTLGVLWHLEPAFGGLRMDRLGIPRVGAVAPSALFLGLKLLLALLGAAMLRRLLVRLAVTNVGQGGTVGAMVGLVGATLVFDSAQAGQPLGLVVADGMFMILAGSRDGRRSGGSGRARSHLNTGAVRGAVSAATPPAEPEPPQPGGDAPVGRDGPSGANFRRGLPQRHRSRSRSHHWGPSIAGFRRRTTSSTIWKSRSSGRFGPPQAHGFLPWNSRPETSASS